MKISFAIIWLSVIQASNAIAEVSSLSVEDDNSIKVHGFISQGFLYTATNNNYLSYSSSKGTFDFTEAGINFTKSLTDKMTTGFQLFSRRLGSTGSFDAKFDWFYLDYHAFDWLGIRAGRIKIPFGLYNEVNDVDSARNYILLPQSIYPAINRDYLLAQNGVELYGYRPFGGMGALDYRLYAGTIYLNALASSSNTSITNLNTPYLAGGRVLWETPIQGLRGGLSLQTLQFDFNATVSGRNSGFSVPALLWVASVEYWLNKLQFSIEYSKWNVGLRSNNPSFTEIKAVSEREYAMVNYRLLEWLQPGLYYSMYFPDVGNRDGISRQNHDLAMFVRFDLNPHWLLKLEGHYMYGTASLSSTLNNNTTTTNLSPNWGAFIVKTTGYF